MNNKYDFSGWATKADQRCSDGRVIQSGAFKHNSGQKVPLVWNHGHDDPKNILGYAVLEHRAEGVWAYGVFNETENAASAKALLKHGDIEAMSIWANQLIESGENPKVVSHGDIKEVSLVLAGANPGALIQNVICHGVEDNSQAVIYTGGRLVNDEGSFPAIKHSDPGAKDTGTDDETIEEVFNTLSDKQKTAMALILAEALNEEENQNGGKENMKHNVFQKDDTKDQKVLAHSVLKQAIAEAKKGSGGSLKDAFMAHATDTENTLAHGITNLDYLFPEAHQMDNTPTFIKRDDSWVSNLMGKVKKLPFGRIASRHADITADEARAKGYVTGAEKTDEVFSLLKRATTPTTIYKKQSFHRDNIIDITDFDVISWVKGEMRMMLDEEIARAMLVGDGRGSADADKIDPLNVRPIYTDADLYSIKHKIELANTATDNDKAKAFIRAAVKSRKTYKGAGNPTLYTTQDLLADMLLLEDTTGRRIYNNVNDLATAMLVKEIVVVPVMEGVTRDVSGDTRYLMGIIVNPNDYSVGADKGGQVTMFDDFDIDFNKQKYLIETRCSGALAQPYSAIVIELDVVAG